MDAVQRIALDRATMQLGIARGRNSDSAESLADFYTLARRAACSNKGRIQLDDSDSPRVAKAAHAIFMSDWPSPDVQTLLSAFLASIAPRSLFEAIAGYGLELIGHVRAVTVASGFTGDTTAEGFPKAVRRPMFASTVPDPRKITALVVLSDELARLDGAEGVFRRELESAVLRATNAAVVALALDAAGSPSPLVAPVGTDALANLRALVAAVPVATEGIVVAAQPGLVADLALRTEAAEGFTLRGGEFRRGLSIIAVDDLAEPMVAIAASQIAFIDQGLRFDAVRQATIEISDAPTMPDAATAATSLWQAGLIGLRLERSFELNIPPTAVCVLGE